MANAFDEFDKIKPKGNSNAFSEYKKQSNPTNNFLAGINESIDAGLRFLPETLVLPFVNGVLQATGNQPLEKGPDTMFKNVADKVPVNTGSDRVARKAGNFAGDAGQIAAATVATAGVAPTMSMIQKSAALSSPGVKSTAKLIADDILRTFKSNPATASAVETGYGALAGAGAGVANEIAPDSAGAEMAGSMAAVMAPTVALNMPSSLAVRGASKLRNHFSQEQKAKRAREEVNTVLGQELTDEAKSNLSSGEALEREIPDLDLSLAEKTEATGLLTMQRALESKATGAELEKMALRNRNNVLAIKKYGENRAPEGEPVPEVIFDAVDQRVSGVADAIQRNQKSLDDKASSVANNLPQVDRAQQGAVIRDRYKVLKAEKAEEMSKIAKDLGIEDIDVTDSFALFTKNLIDELKPQSALSDSSNVPDSLKDLEKVVRRRLKANKANPKKAKPFVFKDIKAFRERLGDEIRDEMQSANPKAKKVRELVISKKRIDQFIDDLADEGAIPDELVEKYSAFRNLYKEEYINKFENGAAFRIKQRGQGDFYKTLDEKVSDVFFQPGGITRAREFKAAFEGDDEAFDALESSILDKMRESIVKDGVVNPKSYVNWFQKHDSVLREFPEIRSKVKDIGSATSEILGRQSQIHARQKFLQTRSLYRKLESVKRDAKTADAFLQESFRNPKIADQIKTSLKNDPEALKGYKRWVWDQATSGKAEDIKKFIFNNEDVLQNVLGDEHFKNIKTILQAEEKITLVPPATGEAFEPIPFRKFEEVTGMSIPSALNRGYAVQSGRVQKAWLYAESLIKSINQNRINQMEDLMKEALYNPDLAKILASEYNATLKDDRAIKKLNSWFFQMGAEALNQEPATESDNAFSDFN